MDSARNKTENRKPTKHIKVWDVQTMCNRLFEIFWQQCQTHILKSKSQEPSLDLSLSESSGSRTTEECQVKAAGGISRRNHNRSFLEGGNQSSAFWTIAFVWCQVRTTVAPGELWLIIYLCNPKGSWMYMVPSPVGWQIKIYQSWWWTVLDLQQFGGLLYTQLAEPGTLGGHRQAPGWRGSRVEYGLSRNEEHWRTMDRETVMFFCMEPWTSQVLVFPMFPWNWHTESPAKHRVESSARWIEEWSCKFVGPRVRSFRCHTFSLEAQRVLSPCSSSCCDLKSWGHFPFNWSHALSGTS